MTTPQPVAAIFVRPERSDDLATIRQINIAAFGRADEADLVDALRAEGALLLSLVAELESVVAGHILFSRMWIDSAHATTSAVALSPMAVLPEYQNRGIGGALVRRGLKLLQDMREQIVLVLGHPSYYQRFGFSSEKARLLETPFPPDSYMAVELAPGALAGVSGKVRYPGSFGL